MSCYSSVMYVWMDERMDGWMDERKDACMQVCMWACMHDKKENRWCKDNVCVCMHTCMHAWRHAWMSVCLCMCMYMYVYLYVCLYVAMYVRTHNVCTHVPVGPRVCVCAMACLWCVRAWVCMCVCVSSCLRVCIYERCFLATLTCLLRLLFAVDMRRGVEVQNEERYVVDAPVCFWV